MITEGKTNKKMSGKIPITKEGYDKLHDLLRQLKTVERRKASENVGEAASFGDLSENAEYDAAKEHQAQLEGRIIKLEDRLARADIIDVSTLSGDKVVFGATVLLEDLDTGEELKYTIVGEDEADVSKSLISISSPIARGLIGKFIDDEVVIEVPSGTRSFVVLDVAFGG
jgi:transcription elongation factor GreA